MAVIRKQRGHFLEDFVPGDVYRHKGGKTVTEGLFALFTDFSMTTNPLSKNARYARAYGFDGLVVPPGPRHAGGVQPERGGRLGERPRQPRVHRHALRGAGVHRGHASRPRRACSA